MDRQVARGDHSPVEHFRCHDTRTSDVPDLYVRATLKPFVGSLTSTELRWQDVASLPVTNVTMDHKQRLPMVHGSSVVG
jgi:hypothetical protein